MRSALLTPVHLPASSMTPYPDYVSDVRVHHRGWSTARAASWVTTETGSAAASIAMQWGRILSRTVPNASQIRSTL